MSAPAVRQAALAAQEPRQEADAPARPGETERAQVAELESRLASLGERRGGHEQRLAEIAGRLAELEGVGHELRLAAARGDLAPGERDRLLADLRGEEAALEAERDEDERQAMALAQVAGELEPQLGRARLELARAEGGPLLERERELLAAAGARVAELASLWRKLVENGRELERLRASLKSLPGVTTHEVRELAPLLRPHPTDWLSFLWVLAQHAYLEAPYGTWPAGLREVLPFLGGELVTQAEQFADVQPFRFDP